MADAIRVLAVDAIAAAGSGHPGMPLGMADAATTLWSRFLKFDAADPRWPDRDRFVLSAGHGSTLLYALLHLTGHAGMTTADLARFRRLDSPAGGHPEYGAHPAIEATTGPLGQGLSIAVGMALAERMLASRFGRSLVDHRTWVIASDGDLMQGVSHEAADLAGHLRLEKLTVLWDENSVSLDGDTALSHSADTLKRFAAQGWATKRVDGHDPGQIAGALALALRSRKPTLIACRTLAGTRQGVREAEAPFAVPNDVAERWAGAGTRGAASRRAWLKRMAKHPMRGEFDRVTAGKLPEGWHERLAELRLAIAEAKRPLSGRDAGHRALTTLATLMPELVGGSTDTGSSTRTRPPGAVSISPGSYAGRYIHFGVREHAMAGALNGIALHGGFLPYAGSFCAFSDYMRPALRLAAMMRLRLVHVLTHDGIGVGEDGPTHQPVEQLASFRALPNIHVFRPADTLETVECWELAIRRTGGPSVMVLSRQELAPLRQDFGENRCARGGYVLQEADGPRQVTLIATGSEVAIALEARARLAELGIPAAVVSLPCWELFSQQDDSYRTDVLGSAPRVAIEAASGFGWERWIGEGGIFIGMTGFGASAPHADLYRHFGITPEAITAAVRRRVHPN
ncbi:MAG: transketolase [Acetobacteraceae bacterium]|nr:transketolase [Acetobacteraceae bacterium]